MYDPTTARFLTPDPIEYGGGDPNLYRYSGNDPINHIDPSGSEYFVVGKSKAREIITLLERLGLQQYKDFRLEDVTMLPRRGWPEESGKEPVYYVVVSPSAVERIRNHPQFRANILQLNPLIQWDDVVIELPGRGGRRVVRFGSKPAENAQDVLLQLYPAEKRQLARYNYEIGFEPKDITPWERVLQGNQVEKPGDKYKVTKGRPSIGDILGFPPTVEGIAAGYAAFGEAVRLYPYEVSGSLYTEFARRYLLVPAGEAIRKELEKFGVSFDDTLLDVLYSAIVEDDLLPLADLAVGKLVDTLFEEGGARECVKTLFTAILNERIDDPRTLVLRVIKCVDRDVELLITSILDGDRLTTDQARAVVGLLRRYGLSNQGALDNIDKLLRIRRYDKETTSLLCLIKEGTDKNSAAYKAASALEAILQVADAIESGDPEALTKLLENATELIPEQGEGSRRVKELLRRFSRDLTRLLNLLDAGMAIWTAVERLRRVIRKVKQGHVLDPAVRDELLELAKAVDKAHNKLGGDPRVKPGDPIRNLVTILGTIGGVAGIGAIVSGTTGGAASGEGAGGGADPCSMMGLAPGQEAYETTDVQEVFQNTGPLPARIGVQPIRTFTWQRIDGLTANLATRRGTSGGTQADTWMTVFISGESNPTRIGHYDPVNPARHDDAGHALPKLYGGQGILGRGLTGAGRRNIFPQGPTSNAEYNRYELDNWRQPVRTGHMVCIRLKFTYAGSLRPTRFTVEWWLDGVNQTPRPVVFVNNIG